MIMALPADHAEHVSFGADQGAGGAADAVVVIDVRMLGLRAIGAEFALFGGGFGGSVFLLFLAKMEKKERADDGGSDQKRNEIIHGARFPKIDFTESKCSTSEFAPTADSPWRGLFRCG